MKTYIIHGDPIALSRPRCGNGKMYDIQRNVKLMTGLDLAKQHGNQPLFNGPLEINVIFYMAIPKSHHKRFDEMKNSPHLNVPDLDNMIKYICDVSNHVLIEDDRLIWSIISKKVYDDGNGKRTEFTISTI